MQDKHIIINVGRQLGSGGHDIGRMLALDFGAKYYDRELLNLAAKESGLSERVFERNDEPRAMPSARQPTKGRASSSVAVPTTSCANIIMW